MIDYFILLAIKDHFYLYFELIELNFLIAAKHFLGKITRQDYSLLVASFLAKAKYEQVSKERRIGPRAV